MSRPLLVIVTGNVATGKTTLSYILAHEISCPLLSRDALKEGYLTTLNLTHSESEKTADWHIYDLFFETIDLLISKGVSLIAEAAFQDKLWKPKLSALLTKANIRIIICKTDVDLIRQRFTDRMHNNPDRNKFHGDDGLSKEQFTALTSGYVPLQMGIPTLEIDTTNNYNPAVNDIIRFIRSKTG